MNLAFHDVHGKNICISCDGKRATRFNGFSDGVVFSSVPLPSNCAFRISVEDVSDSWVGELKVGLSAIDPSQLKDTVPISLTSNEAQGIWGVPIDRKFSKNSTINVQMINSMLYVDGKLLSYSRHYSNWLVIDLYGSVSCIELEQCNSEYSTGFHLLKGPGIHLSQDLKEASAVGPMAYAFTWFTIRKNQCLHFMTGGGTINAICFTNCNPNHLSFKDIPTVVENFGNRVEYWAIAKIAKQFSKGRKVKLNFESNGKIDFYVGNSLECTLFHVDSSLSYWILFDLSPDGTMTLQSLKDNELRLEENEITVNNNQSSYEPAPSRCIICLESRVSIALIPCGHLAFCTTCADKIIKEHSNCPICRGTIQDFLRVYVA